MKTKYFIIHKRGDEIIFKQEIIINRINGRINISLHVKEFNMEKDDNIELGVQVEEDHNPLLTSLITNKLKEIIKCKEIKH